MMRSPGSGLRLHIVPSLIKPTKAYVVRLAKTAIASSNAQVHGYTIAATQLIFSISVGFQD